MTMQVPARGMEPLDESPILAGIRATIKAKEELP